jgi:GMP synthase-like glutamine amidotransferase
MGEILVFQHDSLEDLGFFAEILEKLGADFRPVRLFYGELPTEDWDRLTALLVLGGPMSACEEETYPFLRWEKTIIRAAIDDQVPVLGIGLGAQLIAAAMGSGVYAGRVTEVGWYPISITPHGHVDSLLGYLPERPIVFQWHRDGFDLPSGALRLASSVYFENQAFRIGRTVYGLQFHLEVTPSMIERWLDERSKKLAAIPYISLDKIRADTPSYASALRYYGERILSEFIRRATTKKNGKEEGDRAKA